MLNLNLLKAKQTKKKQKTSPFMDLEELKLFPKVTKKKKDRERDREILTTITLDFLRK